MHLRKPVGHTFCLHEKQAQQLLSCYEVLAFSVKMNHHPN